MKKITILLFILSSFVTITYAQEPFNDISTISVEDEMMACTMDYNPVCGRNWVTYWNACSAWKNEIAYKWECADYINQKYYSRLKIVYTKSFKKALYKYNNSQLWTAVDRIDYKVNAIKNQDISKEEKVSKITLYNFLQNLITVVMLEKKETDFLNYTYSIDGNNITLKNWVSEIQTSSWASWIMMTQYFWNQVKWDFNKDWHDDIAFLLTQKTWGSWEFYYIAVALWDIYGYKWINAILLWDRVAPQPTNFMDGYIIANYLERDISESMNTQPSIWVSKYLQIIDNSLVEVKK